jgi:hypothetical protein
MDKQTFKAAYRKARLAAHYEGEHFRDFTTYGVTYLEWLRATQRTLKDAGFACDFNQADMIAHAVWSNMFDDTDQLC